MDSISTGCRSLDEVLGGGIPFGRVTLIYGEPSAGKTTLAIRGVVNYLRQDHEASPPRRALYMDSDGKFSLARFSQIAGVDTNGFLKRLLLCMPRTFAEQTRIIEELISFTSRDIRLVVLDTITSLYSEKIASTGNPFRINRELNRQLAFLKEAAGSQELGVLLLSQVHSTLRPDDSSVVPVSSRLLEYWSDVILRLDLTPQAGVRTVLLEKPRRDTMGCRFRLVSSGLIDMGFLNQPFHG